MRSGSKERIAKSASRISGATVLSRILGLARDSIFAALFGTTFYADAFNVAFLIPNFLRRVLGEGTMNASYVPVYTEYLHKQGEEKAAELASKMFSVLTVVLGVVVLGGIISAKPIVATYAFGWKESPETFALTVKLTRILFPYIFFVALAALAAGTLNSRGIFGIPALAPAFLNIALIGAAFLVMRLGSNPNESMITIFSIGALVGGVLQILVQMPQMLRTGHRLKFVPDFKDKGVRWIGRLMMPGMLAFAVTQINVLVDTLLATTLPEGSVTALRLGNRIAVQPLGIFGAAIATAALPTLSAHAARDDKSKFVDDFAFSTRLILAFLIPSGIAMMVLARPVVRLLFERGEFTALRSTPMTVQALFYYAVGLFAYGGLKSVVQAFYSMKDTVTPMKVAIVSVGLNIALDIILVRYYGLIGLALATSISATVGFVLLGVILKRRLGDIRGSEIGLTILKIVAASVVMGVVLHLVSAGLDARAVNIWGKLAQVGISIAAGTGVFLAVSFALRTPEVIFILRLAFGKRGGR
jgi:putative peptidoglycan lipid II flippase